ncbi:MAG: D-alanyl-D-alanine carboxypeptidase [Chloroflexota bacterium]|jgi:D-alanyl-D-alanine carboxypeptidase|nr:D-alanyl-D-alanine carboxypeptidase [Chloroflexota bacterium]
MDPDRAAALDVALADARRTLNAPGLSLAVRLADGTVWTSVVGRAQVGPDASDVTAQTAFSAGSITKTFVATVVMQLVEEGVIHLDDPLSRWLPRYPNGSRISIEELLSHTSGLYDYFDNPKFESLVFGRPMHRWSMSEILALVKAPTAKPGAEFGYSNTNFALLGKVLRRGTGRSVGALVRGRLLEPLGLGDTRYQDRAPEGLISAMGYIRANHAWAGWSDGTAYRPNTSAATVAAAAGAILSTPSDLVRWAHALYAEATLVSAGSVARMTTFNEGDYGLGTELFATTDDPATAEPMWGHSGSLRGFEAQLWYVPSRDVTIALMGNRGRVSLRPVVQELLAALFGGP